MKVKSESHSVTSDSLQPHGLYSPWNSPGQNTGVGSLSLLQGIFLTQGSCIAGGFFIYQLSHKGSPRILEWVACPFSSKSSRLRNWTGVSCIAGGFFTNWALREAHPIQQWEQNQEASWHSRPCPRGYRPQSLQGQGRHSHGLARRASIWPGARSWQRLEVCNLGSDHSWLLVMRRSVPHPATPASPEQLPQEQPAAGGGRPTLSTLARVLAEVSTYCTPHSSALALASPTSTCLRSSRSDLFPTTSSGILSSSALTRRICSLWRWIKKKAAKKAGLGAQFCQPVRDGGQGWGSCRLQPILRKHPSTLRLTGVPQVWFQFAALVTGGAYDKCRFLGP